MKVGIIGSGFVGATSAYALVMRGIGREIVLVDLNQARAQAEADDILHATPFAHPVNIRAGDYNDLSGCKVVIVTAGASQKPGESRLELLGRNAAIFRDIIPRVLAQAPEAVLLIATNPVDVMTHLAARHARTAGIPSSRVLGSGTMLDTARFRALLGRHVGVDAQHIHAYVIGEHGDSEVLTWSLATVGGTPLIEFCRQHHFEFTTEQHDHIEMQVRQAAYHLIEGKGATYYGIGAALARITDVILKDQRSIMTVCTPMDEVSGVQGVTLALPNLVGGQGVLDHFPLNLNDHEHGQLRRSAGVIREAIDSLDTSKQ